MKTSKNKGASEILTQILLLLVTVAVVGIIIGAVVPQITKGKSQIKFKESMLIRDELFEAVTEVYNSPIDFTKEINLKLDGLTLVIDENKNSIEVYSLIKGDFYKDGLKQEEHNGKYTDRRGQKLFSGFSLKDINISNSYIFENQNITFYLKKVNRNTVAVFLNLYTEEGTEEGTEEWFSNSDSGLFNNGEESDWAFRKKIIIDHNKIDEDLVDFPLLVPLDSEIQEKTKKLDGTDIMFTLEDGKTKLKRELEYHPDVMPEEKTIYRKAITFNHEKIEGDLANFPVLISLEDPDLRLSAKEDGSDIYFTLENGERLNREIESFEDIEPQSYYRKKITITNPGIENRLSDFPMLVHLKNEPGFCETVLNGSDIFFTSEEGDLLKREIEYLGKDKSNCELIAWVKVPQIITGAEIYINFGNEKGAKLAEGLINTSFKFNETGQNKYLKSSNLSYDFFSKLTGDFTISAWYSVPEGLKESNWGGLTLGSGNEMLSLGSGVFKYNLNNNSGEKAYIENVKEIIVDNNWYYLTLTYNHNDRNFSIILNNQEIESIKVSSGWPSFSPNKKITVSDNSYRFTGNIDEIRISKKIRSPSWLKAEYLNINNPEEFISIEEADKKI